MGPVPPDLNGAAWSSQGLGRKRAHGDLNVPYSHQKLVSRRVSEKSYFFGRWTRDTP